MKYLIRFEDEEALDPGLVGHKFSSLARALRSGFAVPEAVAINTEANRFYLQNQQWPEGLWEAVLETARKLNLCEGLSIRSSATSEDLDNRSFAGQYKTFLKITTAEELKDKIQKCWDSVRGAAVESYLGTRRAPAPPGGSAFMAVILQKMVYAKGAGVAFSRNPMYPARDEVVVEGVPGLAEDLVSGRITPHRAYVSSGRLHVEHASESDGWGESPMDREQWLRISVMVRDLERHSGGIPQDVEWAMDPGGELWLLQSRPITTIRPEDLDAPPGVWTRKIANDLWADRLTPLLADAMLRNAPRWDLSDVARFFGIPLSGPTLEVINGYLYVNCESLQRVLATIPVRLRTSDLLSLLPPGFPEDPIPPPSPRQLLSSALRALYLPFREPQSNPLLCHRLSRQRMRKLEKHVASVEALPWGTPPQALDKTVRALECMTLIQENNRWPYSYATIFTWVLRGLVVDVAGRPYGHFLELLSGQGRNVTMEIERECKELAAAVLEDEGLSRRFRQEPAQELAEGLPQDFAKRLDGFLKRYGCRSSQRSLYVKRWAEAPEEVLGIVKALVQRGSVRDHSRDLHELRLGGGIRVIVHPVLNLARRFLDLREDLRFLLDKALYLIRRSALVLGRHLELGEQVLFLKEAELGELVRGRMTAAEARRLASERYEIFCGPVDVSPFYIDGRPVGELGADEHRLKGIGTSPGRITGRARIVEDPSRANVEAGDILVARNTDPGWTPILSMVSGLAVEEGGLLNHCSIVARELGIPAVVGVRQATRRIPEGATITVDGGLGVVQLRQDTQGPASQG